MGNKEKWALPVVYVPRFPRGEGKSLLGVIYEVVDVDEVTVVFFWLHWSHDLPLSTKPEYEPLAIAYLHGRPRMVFYRPHNRHEYRKPVVEGRSVVAYISYAGHAPIVGRMGVLAHSLIPFLYRRLGKKSLSRLMRYGEPPMEFLVWKGVNTGCWRC